MPYAGLPAVRLVDDGSSRTWGFVKKYYTREGVPLDVLGEEMTRAQPQWRSSLRKRENVDYNLRKALRTPASAAIVTR